MTRVISWLLCILLVAVAAVPALAGNDDADGNPATPAKPASSTPATSTAGNAPGAASNATLINPGGNVTALLGVLVMKGVLSPSEAKSIQSEAPGAEFQALVKVLTSKGVMSAADLAAAESSEPATSATLSAPATSASLRAPASASPAAVTSGELIDALYDPEGQLGGPEHPAVIPAIAPVRVLPVDPPGKDALKAAFKMGPVKMTPYGFLKATAAYDTSSPNGDDFPFVGLFLTSTQVTSTGPSKDPEFHIKARSARIGANFEWPDASPKFVFTGRIEGDYEGNFSEVDNRDVSSIRSNAFQLRLAYARMDYMASDKTSIYFEGGQDWTLFGSSILPNLLETTFLGAFYGDIYTRSPQFQVGWIQKLSESRNFKFAPTFAIMMPSSGQILKLGSVGLAGQLGQGEREGADSGRPEIEGRAVLQFQLDKAPGVAPAQLIITGFQGRRESIVAKEAFPATLPANFVAAFPNGFTASSPMYGGQIGVQLPTRWVTVVASLYRGGDLRFYFGGQVNSFATDIGGLTNVQGPFQTLDGGPLAAAGGAALGINGAGQVVVAPQRPIRSYGGFINVGFPLSRWFNAKPDGRNAGWQLYLHAGKDQVVDRDLNNPNFAASVNSLSPLPLSMGKLAAATLYYKVNPWCTFGFEQSIYATRLLDGVNGYTIAGVASNEWQDHRSEFGPIFTF